MILMAADKMMSISRKQRGTPDILSYRAYRRECSLYHVTACYIYISRKHYYAMSQVLNTFLGFYIEIKNFRVLNTNEVAKKRRCRLTRYMRRSHTTAPNRCHSTSKKDYHNDILYIFTLYLTLRWIDIAAKISFHAWCYKNIAYAPPPKQLITLKDTR